MIGERIDINSAMVASVIANVNRDSKKKKKPFTIDDFLIKFRKKPSKVSDADAVKSKVKGFLGMIGAKQKKREH